tara:strand:+ start:1365 stop:1943 length:579 start_codon:yes stop_codon:yes gene_type:complete
MSKDEYIAVMEQNIKLLQQKINVLDDTNGPYESIKIPEFKIHKSRLPSAINDFNQNNSKEIIKGHLMEGYREAKARKIIPIPGITASFCYDFSKNKSTWIGPMQLIYGWLERYDASFEEVLGFIVDSDKQRFQDVAFGNIGKKNYIATEAILLENGNQIIEEYNYLYHGGDYEKRSPILLQGKTTLTGINKR